MKQIEGVSLQGGRMGPGEGVCALVFQSVGGVERAAVLLVQRRDVPVWTLPGGGVEVGETPAQAASRELEEETGFRTRVVRQIGVYTPLCLLAGRTRLYECQIVSGTAAIGAETKALAFYPVKALPKLLPPPYRDWIEDGLLNLEVPLHQPITSVTYHSLMKAVVAHPLLVTRFLLARLIYALRR